MPHTPSQRSQPAGAELSVSRSPSPEDAPRRRVCVRVAHAVGDQVRQVLRVPALETLRVGSSERNELVLCDPSFGESHTLLAHEDGGWSLLVPAGLVVRARLGGQAVSMEEHLVAGRAQRRGALLAIPLAIQQDPQRADAWASVVLELETGRLLLAVEERTAARVASLPRSLKTSVGGRVDWRFAGTLSVVMLAFFFMGLAAEAADPLLQTSPPESVFAFRPLFEAPPLPSPNMPADPDTPTQLANNDVPRQVTRGEVRDGPRGPRTGESGSHSDNAGPRLTTAAARAQTQELLGSIGDFGLRDRLAGGAVVTNAGALLDDVREGAPNSGPATGLGPRVGQDTTGQSLGALRPAGTVRSVDERGSGEERPVHVGLPRPPTPTGPGFMPQGPVTIAIRGRIGAIRRCYERTLASNPAARGRVVMSFRVEMSGAFSGVTVAENATNDPQLAACMVGIFARMRVSSAPEGGAVQFRYPFVFEPG